MKYSKLRILMVEKGIKSIRSLASIVDMSYPQLCLKFEGNSEWKKKDIIRVCKALDISAPMIGEIFFPEISQM